MTHFEINPIPHSHPKLWLRVDTPFGECPLFARGIDSLAHIWTIADEQREYTEGMPLWKRIKYASQSYSKALMASVLHLFKVKKPHVISYYGPHYKRQAVRLRKVYRNGKILGKDVYHNLYADMELITLARLLGYEPKVFYFVGDFMYESEQALLFLTPEYAQDRIDIDKIKLVENN